MLWRLRLCLWISRRFIWGLFVSRRLRSGSSLWKLCRWFDFYVSVYIHCDNYSMIPVPFTVTAALLMLAFCISKLQYPLTHFFIALHSVLGLFESATLAYSLVMYLQRSQQESIYIILFVSALGIIAMLNMFGLIVQTPFIVKDVHFQKWTKRREKKGDFKCNYIWFYFISLLAFLSNYKLKMLLFSGFFNFDCLKCKLETVQKFRIFNVFSFLGLVP